ncbi:MAG TPA: hypothetical protein VKV06_03040 [Acidimicrobiales bacterium]|nr:hypothetical protein [Acidimicrobiales bacterium]
MPEGANGKWSLAWLATAVAGLLSTWFALGIAGSGPAQAAGAPPPPWHSQTLPGTAPGDELKAVSCSSATFCMAVGDQLIQGPDYQYESAVAEAWNGTKWRPVAMANPSGGASESDFYVIGAVSCVSRTACVAVGNVEGRTLLHTLAEVWNGTTWRTTAAVAAGNEPALASVSCVSATDCMAVGDYTQIGTARGRALAEKWNGTSWTRTLHSSTVASLGTVSCPSASLCFAGGRMLSGIERWNGQRWTLTATNAVTAPLLSCASTHHCLAVGCPNSGTCLRSGLQNSYAWNGSTWRQVTTNGAKRQNLLQSLSCVSATSCTAVGGLEGSTTAVAARWNGHDWTLQRDPGGASGLSLWTVSCVATACEAIGQVPVPHNYGQPTAIRSGS